MIELSLVRANGTPVLAGQVQVVMVPDLVPVTGLFVNHGHHFIQLAGAAELEPGDLMGSASASLLRVPAHTLDDQPRVPESPLEVPGPLPDWERQATDPLAGSRSSTTCDRRWIFRDQRKRLKSRRHGHSLLLPFFSV